MSIGLRHSSRKFQKLMCMLLRLYMDYVLQPFRKTFNLTNQRIEILCGDFRLFSASSSNLCEFFEEESSTACFFQNINVRKISFKDDSLAAKRPTHAMYSDAHPLRSIYKSREYRDFTLLSDRVT